MKYNFSYIYSEMLETTKSEASVKRFINKTLGCQCFDKAFVLPSKDLWKQGKCYGGVVTEKGEFVESSAWHEGDRCGKYDFNQEEAIVDDSEVIYLGFYNSCWGHAITDNLKKLWFLKTEKCKRLLADGAKVIYLTVDNQQQPSYVYRLFELAGVDLNKFQLVSSLTRFRSIYIPDNSFIAEQGQRYFTKEYIETIEQIKHNVASLPIFRNWYPNKVYFTRTHLNSSRDFGEKTIERVFRKKGFSIVAPEEYSIEEQISMLMHCTSFAATEGSISHNVVFCNIGIDVIVVRKCFDVNKYQMAMNELADVNVTYIDAHKSIKAPKDAPWAGPFYLLFNKNLSNWSNSKIYRLPFFFHKSWWKYLLFKSPLDIFCRRLINKLHEI